MSNVITLKARSLAPAQRVSALASCFAQQRRNPDDVFWLKENAEFLNVLESSGQRPDPEALEPYAAIYDDLPQRFSFFPQYYRFLLSICLDLEDLGLPGTFGTELSNMVAQGTVVQAELSDLQRAEARRLLARRGVKIPAADAGLDDRLRAFVAQSASFALPNKKAAYELTHIVFYLSEYGRRDPDLPEAARLSLINAGLLAWLEGNTDLLAEICIALRFAGFAVPEGWNSSIASTVSTYTITANGCGGAGDDYHAYLITHWHGFLCGLPAFQGAVTHDSLRFDAAPVAGAVALRQLSETLYGLQGARRADWSLMRRSLQASLSPDAWSRLDTASAEIPEFEMFFQQFARAPQTPAQMRRIG